MESTWWAPSAQRDPSGDFLMSQEVLESTPTPPMTPQQTAGPLKKRPKDIDQSIRKQRIERAREEARRWRKVRKAPAHLGPREFTAEHAALVIKYCETLMNDDDIPFRHDSEMDFYNRLYDDTKLLSKDNPLCVTKLVKADFAFGAVAHLRAIERARAMFETTGPARHRVPGATDTQHVQYTLAVICKLVVADMTHERDEFADPKYASHQAKFLAPLEGPVCAALNYEFTDLCTAWDILHYMGAPPCPAFSAVLYNTLTNDSAETLNFLLRPEYEQARVLRAKWGEFHENPLAFGISCSCDTAFH